MLALIATVTMGAQSVKEYRHAFEQDTEFSDALLKLDVKWELNTMVWEMHYINPVDKQSALTNANAKTIWLGPFNNLTYYQRKDLCKLADFKYFKVKVYDSKGALRGVHLDDFTKEYLKKQNKIPHNSTIKADRDQILELYNNTLSYIKENNNGYNPYKSTFYYIQENSSYWLCIDDRATKGYKSDIHYAHIKMIEAISDFVMLFLGIDDKNEFIHLLDSQNISGILITTPKYKFKILNSDIYKFAD